MNEEELFYKLFPEYAVNGKPLSPYFDLFESGYEEAENKLKCCENCNNFMHRIDHRCNTKCKNLSEWEIKEK